MTMSLNIHSHQVQSTSAEAYDAIGIPAKKRLQDAILDAMSAASAKGVRDLSGQELRRALETQYSLTAGRAVRVDTSSMTSPITRLIDANRIERLKDSRPCSITGQNIHPLRLKAIQARLVS